MCDEQGRDSDEVDGLVMIARRSASETDDADVVHTPSSDLITFEVDDSVKQQQFEGMSAEDVSLSETKTAMVSDATAATTDAVQAQTSLSDNVIRTRVIKRLGPEDRYLIEFIPRETVF
ncbi:unnamed protein product [Anisakis simplex]|uniref:Chromo domain-containing protein n=1 Tax=Anisakis simplex TaxID=6269 RepID=A0A0M3JR28_ANISI|nr:unnamed protein product [Anisakis simplex]